MPRQAIPKELKKAGASLDAETKRFMAWKKKYAYVPIKIGKKKVWRKHYWVRNSMEMAGRKSYSLTKPKYPGWLFGTIEVMKETGIYDKLVQQSTIKGQNSVANQNMTVEEINNRNALQNSRQIGVRTGVRKF